MYSGGGCGGRLLRTRELAEPISRWHEGLLDRDQKRACLKPDMAPARMPHTEAGPLLQLSKMQTSDTTRIVTPTRIVQIRDINAG